MRPFVEGTFGKQRRTLTLDNGAFGNYCDPIFGAKGGVEIPLGSGFVLAPSVGGAFNLDEGDRSAGFADVELNRKIGAGFVGAGVGLWDFTSSDNRTGSLLVHFGVPVVRNSAGDGRLLFVVEGRTFFDRGDDLANNYLTWAGLRYMFR